jgi:glutaconate CoA-transferase subunit B
MADYSPREMMAIAAAREIQDGEIVFCGTGISMLAAMAAKHINAPNSVIFFETGAIDSLLQEVPMAVSDPRVMFWTSMNSGLADSFAFMQNRFTGNRVLAILGAAQIDKFGNINSTTVGNYFRPTARFPGSGGACDAASFVNRTIIFMQHEKRKFVNKLDYLTSPGWLDGPEGRKRAGLPGGGPSAVVTDLGVMRFDEKTKEMYLGGLYQGISSRDILDNMQFTVDTSRARDIAPPSDHELKTLREQCDPQQLIL